MSKRPRENWEAEETRYFLKLINERKILKHLDGKKFRVAEIFSHLENDMHDHGYLKTSKQMQIRFRTLRAKYNSIKKSLSVSGSGNSTQQFQFYEEMDELLADRPILQQVGLDSTEVDDAEETVLDDGSQLLTDVKIDHILSDTEFSQDLDDDVPAPEEHLSEEPSEGPLSEGQSESSEGGRRSPVEEAGQQRTPKSRNAKRTLLQNLEHYAEVSQKKSLQNQNVMLKKQQDMLQAMFDQQHTFEKEQLQTLLDGQKTVMPEMTNTFLGGLREIFGSQRGPPLPSYPYVYQVPIGSLQGSHTQSANASAPEERPGTSHPGN